MQVLVGNPKPLELAFDADGRQFFRSLPGEATTKLLYPEGMSLEDAALATIDALKYHMGRDTIPAWIESDNKELHKLLCKHFGIKMTAKRPADWAMSPKEN